MSNARGKWNQRIGQVRTSFHFFLCKVLQEWTWYHIAINKCTCTYSDIREGLERERAGGGVWGVVVYWRELPPPPQKKITTHLKFWTPASSPRIDLQEFHCFVFARVEKFQILLFIWHIFQAGVGVGVNLVQNHEIWLHTLTLYWLMDNYLVPVWE